MWGNGGFIIEGQKIFPFNIKANRLANEKIDGEALRCYWQWILIITIIGIMHLKCKDKAL